MKTLLLFISLFVLQLAAQSQEFIGINFIDLQNNYPRNYDKRYNLDSMKWSSTGCPSMRYRFFHSTHKETRTYGTSVFYEASDFIIKRQVYHFRNSAMDYMHQEFIRLSNKGYKVTFYRFNDKSAILEITRCEQ